MKDLRGPRGWTRAHAGGDRTGGPAPACVLPPPARPPASHLRVVAAHLARFAVGGAEVVVLPLEVPLFHRPRHVHALVRDGEQVLAAPPALLVVTPHALLSVGLGEGGQLLVPPLRGGRWGHLRPSGGGRGGRGRKVRMPTILDRDGRSPSLAE